MREEVRLVTLTGPAGVGKTRLGLQVAAELIERFSDGIFLVSLASVADPEQVIPTIIQTLSLREQGTLPPLAALSAALRDKHLLLLFDNFEQVVEAALQIAALLTSCPRLKILVTSRVKLQLQAEREVIVPPLSVPEMGRLPDLTHLPEYEAIAFFIERARTIKADFELTEATASVVAAICTRLDGLPLAIELAAVRIRYFSLPQLLRQLDHALAVLSQGARDLPARQQTLRGAMAWSYLLLSSQEQQLFRRLAVFVGGCSVQAAARVCTAASPLEGEILEGMLSLVDKSLLWPVEHDEQSPRFRMLQLVRAFGLECLESVGETLVTRQAHATYYLQLAEESTPSWNTPDQRQWHVLLEQEHENLRLALSFLLEDTHREEPAGYLEASQALRLCLALNEFWWVRGYFREARTFFERALSGWATVPPEMQAEALYRLGSLEVRLNDYEQAQTHLSQSLVISPRTVNTHLTSIYSKIGVPSRSSATRYVMEHHLL